CHAHGFTNQPPRHRIGIAVDLDDAISLNLTPQLAHHLKRRNPADWAQGASLRTPKALNRCLAGGAVHPLIGDIARPFLGEHGATLNQVGSARLLSRHTTQKGWLWLTDRLPAGLPPAALFACHNGRKSHHPDRRATANPHASTQRRYLSHYGISCL